MKNTNEEMYKELKEDIKKAEVTHVIVKTGLISGVVCMAAAGVSAVVNRGSSDEILKTASIFGVGISSGYTLSMAFANIVTGYFKNKMKEKLDYFEENEEENVVENDEISQNA